MRLEICSIFYYIVSEGSNQAFVRLLELVLYVLLMQVYETEKITALIHSILHSRCQHKHKQVCFYPPKAPGKKGKIQIFYNVPSGYDSRIH